MNTMHGVAPPSQLGDIHLKRFSPEEAQQFQYLVLITPTNTSIYTDI